MIVAAFCRCSSLRVGGGVARGRAAPGLRDRPQARVAVAGDEPGPAARAALVREEPEHEEDHERAADRHQRHQQPQRAQHLDSATRSRPGRSRRPASRRRSHHQHVRGSGRSVGTCHLHASGRDLGRPRLAGDPRRRDVRRVDADQHAQVLVGGERRAGRRPTAGPTRPAAGRTHAAAHRAATDSAGAGAGGQRQAARGERGRPAAGQSGRGAAARPAVRAAASASPRRTRPRCRRPAPVTAPIPATAPTTTASTQHRGEPEPGGRAQRPLPQRAVGRGAASGCPDRHRSPSYSAPLYAVRGRGRAGRSGRPARRRPARPCTGRAPPGRSGTASGRR